MNNGAKWKKLRPRKRGGGDAYIEESILAAMRKRFKGELEYTVEAIQGSRITLRFRRLRQPKEQPPSKPMARTKR